MRDSKKLKKEIFFTNKIEGNKLKILKTLVYGIYYTSSYV